MWSMKYDILKAMIATLLAKANDAKHWASQWFGFSISKRLRIGLAELWLLYCVVGLASTNRQSKHSQWFYRTVIAARYAHCALHSTGKWQVTCNAPVTWSIAVHWLKRKTMCCVWQCDASRQSINAMVNIYFDRLDLYPLGLQHKQTSLMHHFMTPRVWPNCIFHSIDCKSHDITSAFAWDRFDFCISE